jgi:hypothetical protein
VRLSLRCCPAQSVIALKAGLLETVYGTARGVSASGEERAAIEEHLVALEARNPNPRPTEVSLRSGGCARGGIHLAYI